MLWDPEQIPDLLVATAVEWTDGSLLCMLDSVLTRNKSHSEGGNTANTTAGKDLVCDYEGSS